MRHLFSKPVRDKKIKRSVRSPVSPHLHWAELRPLAPVASVITKLKTLTGSFKKKVAATNSIQTGVLYFESEEEINAVQTQK